MPFQNAKYDKILTNLRRISQSIFQSIIDFEIEFVIDFDIDVVIDLTYPSKLHVGGVDLQSENDHVRVPRKIPARAVGWPGLLAGQRRLNFELVM